MTPMETAAIVGEGMGVVTQAIDAATNYRRQRKLQKLQIQGQKEMGRFNQGMALEMWDKTNAEAQRRHLENAGLNVGLMYGGTGAGGATAAAPTGSVAPRESKGLEGMGIQAQTISQIALMKAQKENIEADTKLKESQVPKGPQEASNIAQDTENKKVQEAIMRMDLSMKEIDKFVKSYTQNDVISTILANRDKAISDAGISKNEWDTLQRTQDARVKQINMATAEQALRIAAAKENINLTQEQIKAVTQEIMGSQVKLSQEERRIAIQRKLQEFSTNADAAGLRNSQTTKNVVDMFLRAVEAITPWE